MKRQVTPNPPPPTAKSNRARSDTARLSPFPSPPPTTVKRYLNNGVDGQSPLNSPAQIPPFLHGADHVDGRYRGPATETSPDIGPEGGGGEQRGRGRHRATGAPLFLSGGGGRWDDD